MTDAEGKKRHRKQKTYKKLGQGTVEERLKNVVEEVTSSNNTLALTLALALTLTR